MPAWFERLFFWPADALLGAVARHVSPLAALLELGSPPHRGVLAASVATAVWLLAALAIAVTYQYLIAFDRLATRKVARLVQETARVCRVVRRRLETRNRAPRPRDDGVAVELETRVDLSRIEAAILVELEKLSAGYAATARELARALALRTDQLGEYLDRLYEKRLVVRTIADGDRVYAASAAGRAALLLRALAPSR